MKDITGEYFQEKRLLHIDIGDGTTEYVVTKGYDYDNDHSSGERHGIGHAIERAKKILKMNGVFYRKTRVCWISKRRAS